MYGSSIKDYGSILQVLEVRCIISIGGENEGYIEEQGINK